MIKCLTDPGTLIEKRPELSVVVAAPDPLTVTVAPANGSLLMVEVTVPVTVRSWADAFKKISWNKINAQRESSFTLIQKHLVVWVKRYLTK
jgi:hypothetical protein